MLQICVDPEDPDVSIMFNIRRLSVVIDECVTFLYSNYSSDQPSCDTF